MGDEREKGAIGAVRRFVVLVGVAAIAAVIAPLALAHPYTATINKSSAGTGDSDPYTITITNNYNGSPKATRAEITIPSGWAVSGLSATATDGTWSTPQVTAGKIVVAAISGGIGYHKKLSISFSGSAGSFGAAICAGGYSVWTPKLTNGRTTFIRSGSAPTVTVTKPGRLASFEWSPIGDPQKAGVGFGGTVTARDGCANVKTNYVGSHGVLSGLGSSPSGKSPDGVGVPPEFAAGVATVAVTGYLAQTTALSLTEGSVSKASNSFTVKPGDFTLSFVTQPGNALTNATIPSNPSGSPITLSAQDTWANKPSVGSTIALSTTPGVALQGTPSKPTADGATQFADLKIAAPNTYVLNGLLTGDGQAVNATSNAFVITASGVTCTAPCTAAPVQDTEAGTTSTVAASGAAGGTLSVSLLTSSTFCGTFAPIGAITNFEVFNAATYPSFDITWQAKFSNTLNQGLISKSLSDVDICLGTINLTYPSGQGPGFIVKGGGTAALQSDGFYWGLLPSCGVVNSSMNPCWYARSKVSVTINGKTNGTVTVKFKVPAPWDGKYGGG